MSEYKILVEWNRDGARFTDNQYSRGHRWRFDGGVEVPASSSPQVVPLPLSVEAAVDPEEVFVASLSSCHMLWFLSIAARRGYLIDRYADEATGVMAKDASGRLAMTRVTLHPDVRFAGDKRPGKQDIADMHHEAHEACFIANSVRTELRCEPTRHPTSYKGVARSRPHAAT
ncbi:MAG: OsmC family protein [Steroidobacteraceae bacterium]